MVISAYQFVHISINDNAVDQLYTAVVMTMTTIAIVTNHNDDIIDKITDIVIMIGMIKV